MATVTALPKVDEYERRMLKMLDPGQQQTPAPMCVSVEHAAKMIGASPAFVRKLIQDKKLSAIAMGKRLRIRPAAIDSYLRCHCKQL